MNHNPNETRAISLPQGGDLPSSTWEIMKAQAKMLVETGFLPQTIKTPQQAVAIMLKGRELGVPAMYSLSNIAVIKGKPTCSAELMLALIYRDHGDEAVNIVASTPSGCTIEYKRRTAKEYKSHSFTMDMARNAGITGNDTWNKFPDAMLRARCISAVARMAFPDSIGGMYTPEELGAQVRVSDDGSVEVEVGQPSYDTRDARNVPVQPVQQAVGRATITVLHPEVKSVPTSPTSPKSSVSLEQLFDAEQEGVVNAVGAGEYTGDSEDGQKDPHDGQGQELAWDRFFTPAVARLNEIGCAKQLVDDFMEELYQRASSEGILDNRDELAEVWKLIRKCKKVVDVTQLRAAMLKARP